MCSLSSNISTDHLGDLQNSLEKLNQMVLKIPAAVGEQLIINN